MDDYDDQDGDDINDTLILMATITTTKMTSTAMMMIFDLWNDAVILKLLLQQSIFLLQCFHLTNHCNDYHDYFDEDDQDD